MRRSTIPLIVLATALAGGCLEDRQTAHSALGLGIIEEAEGLIGAFINSRFLQPRLRLRRVDRDLSEDVECIRVDLDVLEVLRQPLLSHLEQLPWAQLALGPRAYAIGDPARQALDARMATPHALVGLQAQNGIDPIGQVLW